jgi:hypothetical protein
MILGAFFVQIVLLIKATWLYREAINPDAISYLRIAGYYLHGQTDLMVSGVWGPLFSWTIIPWLLIFDDHLLAAHAAVAVSAVVFLFGTYSILRAMKLPRETVVVGTWLTVFLSVSWSVSVVSPDLLMSGIFCYGFSRLLSGQWNFATGVVFGAAYLAKHAALPMFAMVIIALAVIQGTPLREVKR